VTTRQGGDASSPWHCVGESSDAPPRAGAEEVIWRHLDRAGRRHNAWVHVPRIGLPSRRHVCNCSLPPPQCPPRFRRSRQRRHPMARGRTDCRLRCCGHGSASPTATPRGAVETLAREHPDRLPHRRLDDPARRAGPWFRRLARLLRPGGTDQRDRVCPIPAARALAAQLLLSCLQHSGDELAPARRA